jgi:multiple sugar transport system permease protein
MSERGAFIQSARQRQQMTKVLLYVLLIVGAIMAMLPMVWMVSASLMPSGEASTYPPHFFPSKPTLDHYRDLFIRLNLGRNLLNSAFVAFVVTFVSLLINSLAGYAFAKMRFKGRDRTFRILSAGLVLPTQVAMLPLFLLLKQMHLINTY